jgi:hypothetical protein
VHEEIFVEKTTELETEMTVRSLDKAEIILFIQSRIYPIARSGQGEDEYNTPDACQL